MKSHTDLEQSKKLAEMLPIETADMDYIPCTNIDGEYSINVNIWNNDHVIEEGWIPCWSLAALLDVVSQEVSLNSFKDGCWNAMVRQNNKMIYGDTDNPVDACYELILKLHELNLL